MTDDRERGRDGSQWLRGAALQSLLALTGRLMGGEQRSSSSVIGLRDEDGIIQLVRLDAGMAGRLHLPDARPGGRLRSTLLLVDAEESVRQVTRRVLERRGFTVVVASNAGEALSIGRALAGLSLVIADVATPGLPGPQVARCLQEAHPRMAALYTSSQRNSQMLSHHGVSPGEVLYKPYLASDLFAAIDAAIERRAG